MFKMSRDQSKQEKTGKRLFEETCERIFRCHRVQEMLFAGGDSGNWRRYLQEEETETW